MPTGTALQLTFSCEDLTVADARAVHGWILPATDWMEDDVEPPSADRRAGSYRLSSSSLRTCPLAVARAMASSAAGHSPGAPCSIGAMRRSTASRVTPCAYQVPPSPAASFCTSAWKRS